VTCTQSLVTEGVLRAADLCADLAALPSSAIGGDARRDLLSFALMHTSAARLPTLLALARTIDADTTMTLSTTSSGRRRRGRAADSAESARE
jgi:hypothetical protein